MSSSLDRLLLGLARGELPLETVRLSVDELAKSGVHTVPQLIARVQSEILAGHLSHEAGRALLETLENAASRTVALGSVPEPPPADPTYVRPHASDTQVDDRTVRMPSRPPEGADDKTVRMTRPAAPAARDEDTVRKPKPPAVAPGGTLIRPPPAAVEDGTDRRASPVAPDADATVRGGKKSPPPTATAQHDPDATVRTSSPQVPPTFAKTLQAPIGDTQAPYAPTLKAGVDGTQVMASRLVQNLSDVEEGVHGPLEPGSVVKKRFVLETMLGKGGMGLVFGAIDRRKEEAHDPNPRVALKVLNPEFARHPQSFMALQREARKAQTLAHPNVVTVFDFDRDGDAVYMTMELLTGRPLDSMVREARGSGIKRDIALPIIRGIAEGLAYAHRKGIVHSDLKPGNVFIAEDGTPKILDFGISRAVPSSINDSNRDVFDAGSLGAYTEAYATDEMIEGIDPHPADDMYALGIIAYELLTGFHPYQRHSAPNARRLGVKPPPLKGLRMKEARAIERCLALDRRLRPQNAGEFLKLFRGISRLQQATLAVAAVLAVASGYLWYQNYLETHPAKPFEALSTQEQAMFRDEIREGDKEWNFYQQEGITPAGSAALHHYSTAYTIHPRNPQAVGGLRKTADAILKDVQGNRENGTRAVKLMVLESEYLAKYPPVVRAARELGINIEELRRESAEM